jgi:hypothetical protein
MHGRARRRWRRAAAVETARKSRAARAGAARRALFGDALLARRLALLFLIGRQLGEVQLCRLGHG